MNIGEFARLGGVSARMLRHYDTIGLLTPSQVDPTTGRRFYQLGQLPILNRILALKTLGFSLAEIDGLVDGREDSDRVFEMLSAREIELQSQIRHEQHVLDRVKARLRLIEGESSMRAGIEIKQLGSQRLVALSAVAEDASREKTGPVVKALFDMVAQLMDRAQADRTAPVARYVPNPAKVGEVIVTAGYALPEGTIPGLEIETLPQIMVASVILRGPVKDLNSGYQNLARWADGGNHRSSLEAGCWRENFLEAVGEDESEWIIELQLELLRHPKQCPDIV